MQYGEVLWNEFFDGVDVLIMIVTNSYSERSCVPSLNS